MPTAKTTASGWAASSRATYVATIASVVIAVDQLSKFWAEQALDDRVIDIFWTLRFRLIYNTGSAFSLGAGAGRIIAVLVLVVIGVLIAYSRSVPRGPMLFLIAVIIGGAIGNLIDRLFRADDGFLSGGVVDFIDFQWWPVFNIADMAVVGGAIGLMVLTMLMPEPETSDAGLTADDVDDREQADHVD